MDKNSSFLVAPDCLLLLWVALVLYSFHQKRNLSYLQLWSKGLLLIVAEDVARMFYLAPTSPLIHKVMHVCALVAYYFAGLAFFWTACGTLRLTPHFKRYLTVIAVPPLLILGVYGMGLRDRFLYVGLTAVGFAASVLITLILRYPKVHLLCHAALWLPGIYLALCGHIRSVTYYSLFGIYAATAVGFYFTLPHKRWGRTIVITGFSVWSICFLSHPLFKNVLLYWAPLATRVWDLQRFVVTSGLLCLALEDLSAAHEFDALHDSLTGLPNRRLFADRLRRALDRARRNGSRVLLIHIDLNEFKCVNDKLGHPAGDFVLCEVASRLRLATRTTDTLCRLGGDEFCVLIEDLDQEQELEPYSLLLEEKVRRSVEDTPVQFPADTHKIPTEMYASLSIGLATFPDEANSPDELARMADKRMYEDKDKQKSARSLLGTTS